MKLEGIKFPTYQEHIEKMIIVVLRSHIWVGTIVNSFVIKKFMLNFAFV